MEVVGGSHGAGVGTSVGEEFVGLGCWTSNLDAAILLGYSDL